LDTLYIWDDKLIEYGQKVIESRDNFVIRLNEIVFEIHKRLTGDKEKLILQYEPNVKVSDFEGKLKKSQERDLNFKMTHVGPHRDDLNFVINDNDARKFGSQGQQRTAALSCKLAEIELDDVLSELDRQRQIHLLNSIGDLQTIITCTGMEEFVNYRFKYDNIYQVVNGTVINENVTN
jgi:DNA replication and repair protein RecF